MDMILVRFTIQKMPRGYSWNRVFGITKARRKLGKAKKAANQGLGCLILMVIIGALATRGCGEAKVQQPTNQPTPPVQPNSQSQLPANQPKAVQLAPKDQQPSKQSIKPFASSTK
jgi:hypothetical protein